MFLSYRIMLFLIRLCMLRSYTMAFYGDFTVVGYLNKAGHSFRNISGLPMKDCMEHCIADCSCRSFQICGNQCQLRSTNELRRHKECTAYSFVHSTGLEVRVFFLHILYLTTLIYRTCVKNIIQLNNCYLEFV